ncbi:M24 family metallopeptidase [Facilibium subflavum]|uniref:M24 family metallopeptidase n=1 Tax=Facilibium subflavum TaxID=2219058 RepID=UPI000E64C4A2|nr:M24 family metallopeptidase [Facilibium subflavum]
MKDHKGLSFPLYEYQRRVDNLRQRMACAQLDVVMINDPANIFYLTGHQTSGYDQFQSLVIPIDHEPFMVMRFLEQTNIAPRTWVEITRSFQDTENPVDIFTAAINEFKFDNKVIGYEQYCPFFPYFIQQAIIQKLPNATFKDCSGIIEKDRLCKSELEIEVMKKAAKATIAGMQAGIEASNVGISENEVAAKVHHAMYMAGGECPAERPYITAGPRTLYGHATWEGYIAQPDDSYFLEIAGCYRRYHTAMMRTVYLGEPSKAMLAAEKAVVNAINTVLETVKPGMSAAEVAKIATDKAHEGVISGRMISRPGYSLGIAFAPSWDEGHILSLKPGQDIPLQKNMTFHLIPWLYGVENKHVMAISETIRITDTGAESLFDFPRQLFIKLPQEQQILTETL